MARSLSERERETRGGGEEERSSRRGFEPQIASRCVAVQSEESGSTAGSLWGNRMEARLPFPMVD